jgi:hypothetical protein
MREYFVARWVEKALRQGVGTAFDALSKVDFNHEILRFTAELMKNGGHDYRSTLRKLALMSRMDGDSEKCPEEDRKSCARLGRTSVTLFYKWLGELSERDWSGLTLDGAQLAGVDLTGKNFRNTSLRSANLNNAIFVNADFRGADLAGVRLEETGEVSSLAVPRNLDGFFAAYSDGSIRQWNLSNRSREESRVIYQVTEKSTEQDKPLQIAALPGDGLCLYDRDHVIFLDAGQLYKQVGRFETQKRYLNVVFSETGMNSVERGLWRRSIVHTFDFSPNGSPVVNDLVIDACVHCARLGDIGVVVALENGHLLVYSKGTCMQNSASPTVKMAEFASPSSIASIGPVDIENRTYFVACGGRDGTVGLWRLRFYNSLGNIEYSEIFRKSIHKGTVTTLSFVGPEDLLTGGMDNKIILLDISDIDRLPSNKQIFELKLQCRGMKIDGLRGERERKILDAAIALERA